MLYINVAVVGVIVMLVFWDIYSMPTNIFLVVFSGLRHHLNKKDILYAQSLY